MASCIRSQQCTARASLQPGNTASRVRRLPLLTGAAGFAAVLAVKAGGTGFFGSSAASPESRAEVADIAMAASLLLTGLTWVALEPSVPPEFPLEGPDGGIVVSDSASHLVGAEAAEEARWAHSALTQSSRAQSTLLVYKGRVIMAGGPQPLGIDASKEQHVQLGEVCKSCANEGKQAHLPSLPAYPARAELEGLVPVNTRCLAMHGVGEGDDGVLIASAGAERAFSQADRAYLAAVANKLSTTIARFEQS